MVKRKSTDIGYKGAQSIYYATKDVAEYVGFPLNTLITINFSMTNITPDKATEAFGLIRNNHIAKWAKRPRKNQGKSFPMTYVYAFENARNNECYLETGDDVEHNVHVLWYLHIPPDRRYDFENKLYETVDYVAGHICPAGTINIQDVQHDNGIRNYLLKGSKRAVAKRFGADKKQSPQGIIIGKRSGTSVNIGASVRLQMDADLNINRLTRLHFAA